MHVTLTAAELAAHDAVVAVGTGVLGVASVLFGWHQLRQEDPVGVPLVLLGVWLVIIALV